MAKQTGMGAAFWAGGNDLSGDINSLGKVSGGPATQQDVTDITQSAVARLGLERDGGIDYAVYFNPTGAHPVLSALPTTDTIATLAIPPLAIGSPVACCIAKQLNYDWTRGADGSLIGAVSLQANGFGLEWGLQLTVGKRTDTAATNGASNNDGAATAFGAQAYLQVFAFTGTDVTVKIQDSADNASFADVAGLTFAQVISGNLPPLAQRLAISNVSTLRQYVRAVTVTTGGFTSVTFAVAYMRNPIAGVVF